MKATDYEGLRTALTKEIDRVVRRFAKSPANRDVYVFAVWCDPENGSYALGLNTIHDLPHGEQGRAEPDRDVATWGFGELAYNQPDFAHRWSPGSAVARGCEGYRSVIETWQDDSLAAFEAEVEHLERFTDAAVLALGDASPGLDRLAQTPYFCAYVQLCDAARERQIALARRTIPPERFDRAFPEVRLREAEIDRVRRLQDGERASYWLGAYADLGAWPQYGPSPLGRFGLTRHDALEEILAIGGAAIHPVLDVVETCALAPEFEEQGSPGWNDHGAYTREAMTTQDLLLRLMRMRGFDARAHRRVADLLRRLVAENRPRALSGLNPFLLACTLTNWFPETYPRAESAEDTNHLLNADSFLSSS